MDRNGNSPAEIAERIFAASTYPAIRRLRCSFCDGELVIAGTVDSFYHKQLAQITVQKLDGVERIRNIVEVMK
jgi:osmotically-inducible protein OsmY